MDGAMGPEEDVVEAVLTCEGDFHDPELSSQIERFRHRLKDLLLTDKQKLHVKKVEPWNSVKVTVTIPREAAIRLRQLAQTSNDALRQIGVLSVQIQGDTQISLTLAGRNNEPTQLMLRTPSASQSGEPSLQLGLVGAESSIQSANELGASPGPSNEEVSRKNIVEYLRHGSTLRQNAALLDSILGTGVTSATGRGMGLGIPPPPDSFPGTVGSSAALRPNNITNTMMQNQGFRGSQINSSFPFTKTTGAFHPPVPRLPSSAGQSSVTNSTHHMPSGSINPSRLVGPLGEDAMVSQPLLPLGGSNHQGIMSGINSFSPVGHGKLPASSSINFNSDILHVPPSSSPSSFIMDLPPPPPYPHSTSSTSRPGKPVTASSPLLVNLLQTDPLAVTAGMASGNPNKPMTAGDTGGTPPKRKKRPKKSKDGMVKPFSLNENTTINKPSLHQHLHLPGSDDIRIPKVADDSANVALSTSVSVKEVFSVDVVNSSAGALPTSHIPDSFSFRSNSNPLFSADRPFSESHTDNPSSSGFQSDSNIKSAIGVGSSCSKLSETNGQDSFPQDLDPFTREIAAGKIVNPYTGQLEPRDSVVDTGQTRGKDQSSHSQGDNFATQMLAKKAKELEELNKKCVPNSSSVLDVNVLWTAIPTPVSVSTSTAGLVRSGGPLQVLSDKFTSSVPSHSRNFSTDSSAREPKESSFYAVSSKPLQDISGSSDVRAKASLHTSNNSSHVKISTAGSNSLQTSLNKTGVPVNGPKLGGQSVKCSVIPSQHQHLSSSLYPTGASSAPSGSVIYSSVMSSSVPLSNPHPTCVTQTLSQHSAGVTVTSVTSSPMVSYTSIARTVPTTSSITHHPRLVSTSLPSSSVVQSTDSLESSHLSCNQQTQAASSELVGGNTAPKSSSPDLLNSSPNKHIDSQSSTESPPDNKASSEGDENSNHSVLAADTLPEHSGTAALLEHSGVKTENHDSGVGSSSERSDDTPSEPGDEFRSSHAGTENDDNGSKSSLQKAVNCKLESKIGSTSNTITVGYIINPSDSLSQSKLTLSKDNGHLNKAALKDPAPVTSSTDISQFYDAHIKTMEKQTGLVASGGQQTSVNWVAEEGKVNPHCGYYGKVKENGPCPENVSNIPGLKMNGPSSQGNIEKMIMAMNDISQKKVRSSPKHSKIGLIDVPAEHIKLQVEVIEEIGMLHQFVESAKESSDSLVKTNSSDKAESPDATSRLGASDDRGDHLIFDMEDLVNGKTSGHAEGKGGSNITSIYSKRSSPVNVNMLNHIYAPGLPLPRRLTESVQRLVKPLPASETSISLPQMRPCKSPGSGGSPRAGAGSSTQCTLRMSVQSGARSPGASIPKLIPSDKHSLLSGGLDLAGLSNHQHATVSSNDQASITGVMVNCKKGMPMPADVLLKDPQSFSSSHHSPPNLSLDSKSYSGKMLSQSYPPHKSRDLEASITHVNHDLLLQSNSQSVDKNYQPPFLANNQRGQFSKSRTEPALSPTHDSRLTAPSRLSQQASGINSNHLPSLLDSSLTRALSQTLVPSEHTHSSSNSYSLDNSNSYSTHSNCSSPVMPILQRGQEPPLTPTLVSCMPTISSQQPPFISSAKEISHSSGSSRPQASSAAVTTLSKHVPYSSNTTSGTAKSPTISYSLPVLSPVSTTPPVLGKIDFKQAASPNYSAPPKLTLSAPGSSTPPKLTKVHTPTSLSPLTQRTGGRNLFESVSGTFSSDSCSPKLSEQQASSNSTEQHKRHKDSPNDLACSVLSSVEFKVDIIRKNMRNKSTESGDTHTIFSTTSSNNLEVLKSSSNSKVESMTHEFSNLLPTEVVNLDLALSSHNSNSSSSEVTTVHKNAADHLKDRTLALSHTLATSTQSMSLLSGSKSGQNLLVAQPVDTVAQVIASVAAGKDEISLKLPVSSGMITPSPMKEPILETLATALGATAIKSASRTPIKSFVEKQVSAAAAGLELRNRSEEDGGSEGKMLSIQSGPQKLSDFSSRHGTTDMTSLDSILPSSAEALIRRTMRKRKLHSERDLKEGDGELSSHELIPVKQARFLPVHGHEAKIISKHSATGDISPSKLNTQNRTDWIESKEEKNCAQNSSVGDLQDKTKEDKNLKIGPTHDDKESPCTVRSQRISTSEDKEQGICKEGRTYRSLTSNAGSSDESQSSRSSSIESKDSTSKESRSHRNAIVTSVDNKEGCNHRTNSLSSSGEEKDHLREGRTHRATSVDHKENSHKDSQHKVNRSHPGLPNTHEDKDEHKESRPRLTSAEDKVKSGKDASFDKTTTPEKGNSQDDGSKKSHRIKRQFYAYVPEKSIDQTYFDTPILSGRTRSKNKPADQQDGVSNQDALASSLNSTDSQSQHLASGAQQATPGKSEGSSEGAGGKRPTRSVRVKENPGDQNVSKRRRVQQHR